MQQIFTLLFYVFCFEYHIRANLLYECNFDNATLENHCFTTPVMVFSGLVFLTDQPPDSPLSDVTSSLKLTSNGEVCKLPFKVDTYTWDMYFCLEGFCPTATNATSKCASGQFAAIQLLDNNVQSFQLKTGSNSINGRNHQNLIYYYYMSRVSGKSITVRKEEVDGSNEVVDVVTSSPFNGWIKREVTFNAMRSGYKLYFEVQRTSPEISLFDIGLDEISIWEEAELTIGDATTTMASTLAAITSSVSTSTRQTTPIHVSSTESTITVTPTTISDAETFSVSTSPDIDTTALNTRSATIGNTYSKTDPIHLSTYVTKLPTVLNSTISSSKITTAPNFMLARITTLMIETDNKLSNTTYFIIIVLTVVPVILIVAIGVIIRTKRSPSKNVIARKRRLYISSKYPESSTDNDLELEPSKKDSNF